MLTLHLKKTFSEKGREIDSHSYVHETSQNDFYAFMCR